MRGVGVRLLLLWLSFTTTSLSLKKQQRCGSEDGLTLMQAIQDQQPDWGADTQLYTPTEQQIMDCRRSALECMTKEMQALLEEWTINEIQTINMMKTLRKLKNKTTDQKQSCDPCEKFTEQPALTFLQFLKDTLQKINTICKTGRGP